MRGHLAGSTRRLNRHWQTGGGFRVSPDRLVNSFSFPSFVPGGATIYRISKWASGSYYPYFYNIDDVGYVSRPIPDAPNVATYNGPYTENDQFINSMKKCGFPLFDNRTLELYFTSQQHLSIGSTFAIAVFCKNPSNPAYIFYVNFALRAYNDPNGISDYTYRRPFGFTYSYQLPHTFVLKRNTLIYDYSDQTYKDIVQIVIDFMNNTYQLPITRSDVIGAFLYPSDTVIGMYNDTTYPATVNLTWRYV